MIAKERIAKVHTFYIEEITKTYVLSSYS